MPDEALLKRLTLRTTTTGIGGGELESLTCEKYRGRTSRGVLVKKKKKT